MCLIYITIVSVIFLDCARMQIFYIIYVVISVKLNGATCY